MCLYVSHIITLRPGMAVRRDERLKGTKKDPFQEFENKTSDAWDDGDDDLIQMNNLTLSLREVQSSAKFVLDNHSKKANALNQQKVNHVISQNASLSCE